MKKRNIEKCPFLFLMCGQQEEERDHSALCVAVFREFVTINRERKETEEECNDL